MFAASIVDRNEADYGRNLLPNPHLIQSLHARPGRSVASEQSKGRFNLARKRVSVEKPRNVHSSAAASREHTGQFEAVAFPLSLAQRLARAV
jgi:hypothetical protein